jgi:arylsulfatase A-like enzyme
MTKHTAITLSFFTLALVRHQLIDLSTKNTSWEGGYRVPALVRWPGVIKPGNIYNDVVSHEDWVPTLMAAAGDPDIKEQLLQGYKVGDKTFKIHLDGYNITDYLERKGPDPRHEFFYFSDDGSLVALRYDQWKLVFAEQRARNMDVWQDPFVPCVFPSSLTCDLIRSRQPIMRQ